MKDAQELASAVDTLAATGPLGAVLVLFLGAFFWMMRVIFRNLGETLKAQTEVMRSLQSEIRSSTDSLRDDLRRGHEAAAKDARDTSEKLTTIMERTPRHAVRS